MARPEELYLEWGSCHHPSGGGSESHSSAVAGHPWQTLGWNMPNEIHSYTELQRQIHQDLRVQHPEWVEPNGESPMCDSYELRLAELLGLTQRANAVMTQPIPFWATRDDY
jgi:hypothetical protein